MSQQCQNNSNSHKVAFGIHLSPVLVYPHHLGLESSQRFKESPLYLTYTKRTPADVVHAVQGVLRAKNTQQKHAISLITTSDMSYCKAGKSSRQFLVVQKNRCTYSYVACADYGHCWQTYMPSVQRRRLQRTMTGDQSPIGLCVILPIQLSWVEREHVSLSKTVANERHR